MCDTMAIIMFSLVIKTGVIMALKCMITLIRRPQSHAEQEIAGCHIPQTLLLGPFTHTGNRNYNRDPNFDFFFRPFIHREKSHFPARKERSVAKLRMRETCMTED